MNAVMLPARTHLLTALTTTISFAEVSSWAATIGARRGRAVMACSENSGNLEFAWAVQTALNDTESANAPVILGAWQSTVARFFRDADLTLSGAGNPDFDANFFFRFLVAYRVKAGGGAQERGTVTILPGFRV